MLKQLASKQLPAIQAIRIRRSLSTSAQNHFKVAILGAAGGIGQPLSMLMKMNSLVSELALYDLVHTPGVAVDLSHIDTYNTVQGYMGPEELPKALRCSQLVIISSGIARKEGMSRDDLFKVNADIIKELTTQIAKSCPKALVAIITNPLNTLVPIASEVLKKAGVCDPNRLFGITKLDVVRTRTFIANSLTIDPQKVKVDVIGGHSGKTIVPVISQSQPEFKGDQKDIENLTTRIQQAGREVIKAKAGAGSATLSTAYSAALFAGNLLKGLDGQSNIVDVAYVESDCTEVSFFSTPLLLGPEGVKENKGIPPLNSYETELLEECIPVLKENISMGIEYVKKG